MVATGTGSRKSKLSHQHSSHLSSPMIFLKTQTKQAWERLETRKRKLEMLRNTVLLWCSRKKPPTSKQHGVQVKSMWKWSGKYSLWMQWQNVYTLDMIIKCVGRKTFFQIPQDNKTSFSVGIFKTWSFHLTPFSLAKLHLMWETGHLTWQPICD